MRRQWSGADVVDEPCVWEIRRRRDLHDARVFTYRCDTMVTPDGQELVRSYLHHPGAVAIMALDEDDRLAVVRQYRHPLGMHFFEPPAGLLDVDGEDPWAAARRELAEEALLQAEQWHALVDLCATPGASQENLRVFLARGLSEAPRPEGFVVEHEEAHMDVGWVDRREALAAVLGGRLHNPGMVTGSLALAASVGQWDRLRAPDAPWPSMEAKRAQDGSA